MADLVNQDASNEQTPIIEGNTATFVWKGRTAPKLVGDFTGWDPDLAIKLVKSAEGVWFHTLPFQADAYIEYGYLRGDKSVLDPQNPRKTSNGIGGYNNFFSMPDYKATDLASRERDIPHGRVTTHSLPTENIISGNTRTVHLYQPPSAEPVPLIVVWDGQDYLKRLRLNTIIDNLINQGRIRPVALAFVNNGGQRSRMVEYACSDATLIFLMIKVIPLAKKILNLIDIDANPGAYGVAGASMGGLMALYTGVRLPQVFGNILSQSGAFSFPDFDFVVFDLLQHGEKRPIKIWMDVGIYDLSGLLDSNRRMHAILQQKRYAVTYREYHSGHSYPAWRDDIWRGLESLYGVGK